VKDQERDADGWLLEVELGPVGMGRYWRDSPANTLPCCLVGWGEHVLGRWLLIAVREELQESLDAVGASSSGTVESQSDRATPAQRLAALEYWLVTYAGYEIVEVDA
jgi:hypothetical protein